MSLWNKRTLLPDRDVLGTKNHVNGKHCYRLFVWDMPSTHYLTKWTIWHGFHWYCHSTTYNFVSNRDALWPPPNYASSIPPSYTDISSQNAGKCTISWPRPSQRGDSHWNFRSPSNFDEAAWSSLHSSWSVLCWILQRTIIPFLFVRWANRFIIRCCHRRYWRLRGWLNVRVISWVGVIGDWEIVCSCFRFSPLLSRFFWWETSFKTVPSLFWIIWPFAVLVRRFCWDWECTSSNFYCSHWLRQCPWT